MPSNIDLETNNEEDCEKTFFGFSLLNCQRNLSLITNEKFKAPKPWKTGTTICGLQFKDGIILGADTRATNDTIVADKNCTKIHYIADNIYCCGAGTAADNDQVTRMMSSKLKLHAYEIGKQPRIVTCLRFLKQMLFRYQGHIGAYIIIGGYDEEGAHLYTVDAHGSSSKLPFVTMGSGSLAAMSVFESQYRSNLTREEGTKIVRDAIAGGIFNDLGSGSNIDVCVITKDKVDYMRAYDEANVKGKRKGDYSYQKGVTEYLHEKVKTFDYDVTTTEVRTIPMDTD